MCLQENRMKAWTGLIWLRTEKGGGLLWMRYWTFGFHKMLWISWLAKEILASHTGKWSIELVNLIQEARKTTSFGGGGEFTFWNAKFGAPRGLRKDKHNKGHFEISRLSWDSKMITSQSCWDRFYFLNKTSYKFQLYTAIKQLITKMERKRWQLQKRFKISNPTNII